MSAAYINDPEKRDPLDGPDEFYGWQPWAMATNELAAMRWLEAHDEDGHDYLTDHEPEVEE